MDNTSEKTHRTLAPAKSEAVPQPTPQADMIAKGLTTSIVVSTIIHAGRGIVVAATRKPIVMFGLGMVAGYFMHKYRKEIASASRDTLEESRNFVLRQKEHLQGRLADNRDDTDALKSLH